jgi:hypothetical protein
VLGDIFSDTYYVMYDYVNKQVGFNGYVLEGLPVIEGQKERTPDGIPPFLYALIVLASVGIIGCVIFFLIKKKKDDELRRNLVDMYNSAGEDDSV